MTAVQMRDNPELARGMSDIPGSFNLLGLDKCESFHVKVSHFGRFHLRKAKYLHVLEISS